ncbi:hypothetical protein ACGF5C_13320 [Micromonospora sp. NPDC047620]|uniref:hypothetical protein n=1 Tax=Micromonospora sp. NPDC047620 TaxID=3364251 RepID=UPI00371BE327
MDGDEGLDLAEELVLSPLEDSPLSLWELGWAEAPSRQRVAEVLGPGLVSLASRGLIEVRRFEGWPAQWERGVPVTGDDLVRESGHVDMWSDDSAHGMLAAHITNAGIRYL